MVPWYKNYEGAISPAEDGRYYVDGAVYKLDATTYKVSNTWGE